MGSPSFKSYWAQWSMLQVKDGVLFRKRRQGCEKARYFQQLKDKVFKQHHGQAEPTSDNTTEYSIKLSEQMEQIHQFARQHLKLSNDPKKKDYYHCPVQQHQYGWGDTVWLQCLGEERYLL